MWQHRTLAEGQTIGKSAPTSPLVRVRALSSEAEHETTRPTLVSATLAVTTWLGMDWTNDSTLDFLEAYRDESVLWDRNDEYHKDKVRTNEAWCRLSKRFGPSVGDLKRKKDSLMATYRSHLRKKKASIRSGAVGVDVYQPVWFAFDFMENFLSPVYDYNSEACSVRTVV